MITFVSDFSGDWVGLYDKDGNLLVEGHSLPGWKVLDALGIEYKSFDVDFEGKYITSCPSRLEDILD